MHSELPTQVYYLFAISPLILVLACADVLRESVSDQQWRQLGERLRVRLIDAVMGSWRRWRLRRDLRAAQVHS